LTAQVNYLGIEIGGTKLQFGIGTGQGGPLAAVERLDVDRSRGAAGIREQICQVASRLIDRHAVRGVGIGFGGPVDTAAGRTIRSFQIDGWDDFPLGDWCRQNLGLPAAVGNDSHMAGLGEARFGAGRKAKVVFYSNVGSGIGGALVIDGELYRGGHGVASEIGHLRPGALDEDADGPPRDVESIASGWAVAEAARAKLAEAADTPGAGDLADRCGGRLENLTAKIVAEAYADGNLLAGDVFRRGIRTYGWAVAQMITLLAPDVVVIGGGVPLVGEALYLAPLREAVDRWVFPPLRRTFQIVPATLGEEVVVHGALALAASAHSNASKASSSVGCSK
jgi:glucokinase